MQFGKVTNPQNIDFTLPKDSLETVNIFDPSYKGDTRFSIGCAKWNRQDLKDFYPRGTKDELSYYSRQFNSIELNASFYKIYPKEQFEKWHDKTPISFNFFPKIPQEISHLHRLDKEANPFIKTFLENISALKEKLGMVFLQMPEDFSPTEYSALEIFVKNWPTTIPLAIELRHSDWFNSPAITEQLYLLYKKHHITNSITDTAGRRDLLHMCLTTSKAFVRFVGANHPSDYQRLENWLDRIEDWTKQGIQTINFFIHQNIEIESVLLSAYFIQGLNKRLNLNIKVPKTLDDINNQQLNLF